MLWPKIYLYNSSKTRKTTNAVLMVSIALTPNIEPESYKNWKNHIVLPMMVQRNDESKRDREVFRAWQLNVEGDHGSTFALYFKKLNHAPFPWRYCSWRARSPKFVPPLPSLALECFFFSPRHIVLHKFSMCFSSASRPHFVPFQTAPCLKCSRIYPSPAFPRTQMQCNRWTSPAASESIPVICWHKNKGTLPWWS